MHPRTASINAFISTPPRLVSVADSILSTAIAAFFYGMSPMPSRIASPRALPTAS